MSSDRVEHLLRRASDDVRATIVRHTVPPPIELIERGPPVRRPMVEVAAIAAAVSLGLLVLGDRRSTVHEPVEAPPPVSTVERDAATTAGGSDDLCGRVVGVAEVLAAVRDDTVEWVALGHDLDGLAAELDRRRSELDADSVRRYDRFVVLAGQAVELGAQGGLTPAAVRADDAVAVAADLVEFAAEPGCELELPQSSVEEDP